MLQTIHDEQNRIIAYVEWGLIDDTNQVNDVGTTCFIRDFFVHPSLNIFPVVKRFTMEIIKVAPWIQQVYFQRGLKYGNDSWRVYKTEIFLRRILYGNKDRNSASPYCGSPVGITVG